MKDQLEKVREFNEAFGLVSNDKPVLLTYGEHSLKASLMDEELREYWIACKNKDITGIADAITDMYYVLHGICIAHGMQHIQEEMFNEVHRSNMSKLQDGKPIYNGAGKVMKGDDYSKPDLKQILDK